MKTTVKGLWKGMIPIRSKFVDEAVKLAVPLTVRVGEKQYVLSVEQLQNPRARIRVADRFNKVQFHWLYYYPLPKVEQPQSLSLFGN